MRNPTPNPGWTAHLGDIGRLLGISAVAVGKILELLGLRSEGSITDSAIRAGCGVRRWDGFALFYDWHTERVLFAIRSAAEDPTTSAVANALAAAIAKQKARDRVAACKRKQEDPEAAGRQEEEVMISGLEVELRVLRATDPGMDLLTAVEYTTSDPAARILLYRRCNAEDGSIGSSGTGQDDTGLSTVAWSVAKDLALLERRARSEGFQIWEDTSDTLRHRTALPERGVTSDAPTWRFFLHHPSCAQAQRHQVGGSCRFYPASRHSQFPHDHSLAPRLERLFGNGDPGNQPDGSTRSRMDHLSRQAASVVQAGQPQGPLNPSISRG